jgi:homoserine kinase type II
MNAVTQPAEQPLEDDLVEATLARYEVGQITRHWPATNGIENRNHFVTVESAEGQRDFVLTIVEQPSNAGEAYVGMMEALAASGLPVAAPIRNAEGLATDIVDGRPAMLQPRLSGRHVFNPTSKQVRALARSVARMHRAAEASTIELPDYPRDAAWLAERADLARGYIPYTDTRLLDDVVSEVQSLLNRRDVANLPRGWIHADLFRDNVLFNEHGLSGLIDFHHAATGYLVYDLAVIANDWCNDATGQLDPERTLAMLRAYHQIRPLASEEIWFFSNFALYAALAFWLSRLSVALDPRNKGRMRFKNPDEFKRIVEQHIRHFFYVDERLITL